MGALATDVLLVKASSLGKRPLFLSDLYRP
jgi:hypothetical protein